jgi:protoporphyrinogen/coproporphyrinogen III oxidase
MPTPEAAELPTGVDPRLGTALAATPSTSTVTVNLAWPDDQIPDDLRGAGFLAPDDEDSLISYCSLSSRKYRGRAGPGYLALRAALRGQQELLTLSDDELARQVSGELAELLGIQADPQLHHVARQPQAIPELDAEHGGLLDRIQERLTDLRGLGLAGNTLCGAGVSNCIDSAGLAVDKVLGELFVG